MLLIQHIVITLYFSTRQLKPYHLVVEPVFRLLSHTSPQFQLKGLDLGSIRTCLIVAEERPKTGLINNFSTLASELGLPSECISTTFGCRANVGMCCRVSTNSSFYHYSFFAFGSGVIKLCVLEMYSKILQKKFWIQTLESLDTEE